MIDAYLTRLARRTFAQAEVHVTYMLHKDTPTPGPVYIMRRGADDTVLGFQFRPSKQRLLELAAQQARKNRET